MITVKTLMIMATKSKSKETCKLAFATSVYLWPLVVFFQFADRKLDGINIYEYIFI